MILGKNNLIYVTIILLLSIFFAKYSNMTDNFERHLYDCHSYAHYSKITNDNIILHPKYIMTHPTKYILNIGDALIIPKGWWHWVFSEKNTFGINYWHNKNIEYLKEPKIVKRFVDNLDIVKEVNNIENNKVQVLNGSNNKIYDYSISDMFNTNKKEIYFMTLPAFIRNPQNKKIFDKYINHPKFITENKLQTNYNLWYSPNEMDTGLHYDDNNGILCVLNGKKTVYLFPPSDTKYLYPYDIKPNWINKNKYEIMEFNIFKNNNITTSKLHPSKILYESFRDRDKELCKIVDEIDKNIKNKKMIYGIKKDINTTSSKIDEIWWEFYLYNMDEHRKTNKIVNNFDIIDVMNKLSESSYHFKNFSNVNTDLLEKFTKKHNSVIYSFEVREDSGIDGNIDIYTNNSDTIETPFYGETYRINSEETHKFKFILLETQDLFENIGRYLNYLNITHVKNDFIKKIKEYSYVDKICIWKKPRNVLCIQWFGITDVHFMDFLIKYNWDENICNIFKFNDTKHINKEISINYDINGEILTPTRTSFYGLVEF